MERWQMTPHTGGFLSTAAPEGKSRRSAGIRRNHVLSGLVEEKPRPSPIHKPQGCQPLSGS